MTIGKKLLSVLAVLLVFVCAVGAVGLADSVNDDASGVMFLKTDTDDEHAVRLIEFKAKLNQLGFYDIGVGDTVLASSELDNVTMAAVLKLCRLNPELAYYPDGISNILYWRVMGEGKYKDQPVITPQVERYSHIAPGTESDAVNQIQDRLGALGYGADFHFKPKVYDDALQKAIDAFVRCNNLTYAETGITAALQEKIFSDSAKPYTAVAVERDLSDVTFGFLESRTDIVGLKVPNYVLLIVGFILLCVIALLVVKLVSPKSASDGKIGDIRFTVEYGGEKYVHRVSGRGCVRIGRETGDFPMNLADNSVSRKHCEIYYDNGTLLLRDFSTFGTKINGEVCHHSQHAIKNGDVLEVGQHRITVQF